MNLLYQMTSPASPNLTFGSQYCSLREFAKLLCIWNSRPGLASIHAPGTMPKSDRVSRIRDAGTPEMYE